MSAVSEPAGSPRKLAPLRAVAVCAAAAILIGVARAGHELPVYPSYYPHEIAIEAMPPERAADLLGANKLHAYIGAQPAFSGEPPRSIRTIESLGSFVVVRLNTSSPAARERASACALIETILGGMAGNAQFVFHPYPVTPFHGDYLYLADLAAAAKARFAKPPDSPAPGPMPKIKVDAGLKDLIPPEWIAADSEWDAAVETTDAGALVATSMASLDGWIGPPWLKAGWFHADRLLADDLDDADASRRADAARARLQASEERDSIDRINLERELVTALTGSCRKAVAGYTVKREFFNAEFTEGVENIGFDAIAGLNSPMFLRTVKLKDFPWNGWLALGIDSNPDAAFNPVAGFSDPFGRLLWSAVGDPALVPQPYDSGWMLNRISDVRANSGR